MHVDLNLLTALDALLEEGSVAGAAERLHLTQPAMSRALGRVRRVMDDQILVRSGRAMTPTPRAISVRAQVHDIVQRAQTILAPELEVDLETIERTFTIRANDAIATAIGVDLVARVTGHAPGVKLRLVGESETGANDLRDGRVDLAISADAPDRPDIRRHVVAADRLVAVMRADHPVTELTIDAYASAQHVTVSRRGRLSDRIDDVLAARGLRRRVVASVPTASAALHIVAHSDFMTIIPERLPSGVIADFGLRTMPLPFDLDPVAVILAWHRRYDDDKAHAWFRVQASSTIESCFPAA